MDDFAKNIQKRFLEEFPNWASYIVNNSEAFEAKIPSPSKHKGLELELEAFGDELTVFFDSYHAHFDSYGSICAFNDALELIKKITSTEYALITYRRGKMLCGTALVKLEDLPSDNKEYPYADIVIYKSWYGDLDRSIKCHPTD